MNIQFRVEKKFPEYTLHASGSFEQGFNLWGKSGSGKTALLSILAGFEKPDLGEIILNNRVLFNSVSRVNVPLEERNLGIIFSQPFLFPHLSVRENILFALKTSPQKKFFNQVVDFFRLYQLFDRKIASLNKDESFKVAFARAIMRKPELILVDEPHIGRLKEQLELISFLGAMEEMFRIPIIYATHTTAPLMSSRNPILLMSKGKTCGQINSIEKLFEIEKDIALDDFENLYQLRVTMLDPQNHLAALDLGGQTFYVNYSSEQLCPNLRVSIKANDIMVATERPKSISAQNILSAQIKEIIILRSKTFLYTQLNDKFCMVEINRSALDRLSLKKDQTVLLVIKSSSVCVL